VATQEIQREGWEAFCDSFSRLHEGWRVDVTVRNGDERTLVRDMPFAGITAELNVDGEDSIEVTAGDEPGEHVSHTVYRAARIWLDQTEQGADEALRIESSTGAETVVRFYSTVAPDMLNGV
jgi:hypothetical protein